MLAVVCTLAGCGNNQTAGKTQEPQKNATTTSAAPAAQDQIARDTALSNPATVYCLEQGGKFTMNKTLDGSTEGLCVLPDNITCEEWAFYRGDCPAGAKKKRLEEASSTAVATTTQDLKSAPDAATTTKDGVVGNAIQPEAARRENPKTNDGSLTPAPDQNPQIPEQDAVTGLELTAEQGTDPGEITNSWKIRGLKATDGFIVMLSGQEQITYPAKYSKVLKNPLSRSYVWTNLVAGRTYYFRVCLAVGDSCQTYSTVVNAIAK